MMKVSNRVRRVILALGVLFSLVLSSGCSKEASTFSRQVELTPKLSANKVDENSPSGTVIGSLSASANYSDVTGPYSYSLASENPFVILDGDNIVLINSPSFEENPQIPVSITVSRQNGPQKSTATISIAVQDINESPTDIQLSKALFYAHEVAGFVVGTLKAIDPDKASNEKFTFSIESQSIDNLFKIEENKIILQSPPPMEEGPVSLTIQVKDKGELSFSKEFTLQLKVNHNPENLSYQGTTSFYAITAKGKVGTLSAIDPDQGDSISYSLSPESDEWFSIVNGNELHWKGFSSSATLNRTVKFLAQDQVGGLTEKEIQFKFIALGSDGFAQTSRSATKKVDIVWIMDDSLSMDRIQDLIRLNFNDLIEDLSLYNNVDYRMSITTTDVYAPLDSTLFPFLIDGRFMNKGLGLDPAYNNPSFTKKYLFNPLRLDSKSQSKQQLIANFSQDIMVGTAGHGQESGLLSALLSLARAVPSDKQNFASDVKQLYLNDLNDNENFFRSDAELMFIIVGDEDDRSEYYTQSPYNNIWKLPDANVSNIVWEMRKYAKILKPSIYSDILDTYRSNDVAIHSIVQNNPQMVDYAERYLEASTMTEGLKLNVNSTNYSSLLKEISQNLFRPKVKFALKSLPDINTISIEVTEKSGVKKNYSSALHLNNIFKIEGKAIIFLKEIPGEAATIKINYEKV